MGDMHGMNGTYDVNDTYDMHDAGTTNAAGNRNMDDIFGDADSNASTGEFSGPPPEGDGAKPNVGTDPYTGNGPYTGNEPYTGNGPHVVPVSALMDERRKRQAAEAELGAMADQVAASQTWQENHPEGPGDSQDQWAPGYNPDPSYYPQGNPGGDGDGYGGGNLLAPQESAHLLSTETAARSRYADFDHKLDVFERMAAVEPRLLSNLRLSPDPSEYAYRTAAQAVNGSHISAQSNQTAVAESLSGVQSASDNGDTRGWRPATLEEILGA